MEATRATEIYAAGPGQVDLAIADQGHNCDYFVYGNNVDLCPEGSRGNAVRIRHDANGYVKTFYLHFSTVFVNVGDWVDENTILGLAGDSGNAAPGYVHLHFERRHGPNTVDPVPLKGCHGDQVKSYPAELGKTSWSQVTAYRYTVRSDGTACAPATTTTLGGTTTTTVAQGTTTTTAGRTTTTLGDGGPRFIGSASGYSVPSLTLFGGVPGGVPVTPRPTVTLASDGSNSPQTASAPSAAATFGPATIFSSGAITVKTEASLRAGGTVTSATDIQNVNASHLEVFTAASLESTCTASGNGVRGSTTITGGILRTSEGDRDVGGDQVEVSLPLSPPPNTVLDGRVETVGDSFRYVFNEQIVNEDKSLTVYAAHLVLLGPAAIGDVYIGRVDCGVPLAATSTTLATTTTSSTTTMATTTSTRPTITPPQPTLQLPAEVSAQVCAVLDDLRSLPMLSWLQPYRLLFGCGR